ncbi:hydantoinase/oxoprolinase family protein [Halobellus litoreus]|uniref:Hydantoinase/oxoprolinase family protein n=1 Tax=Halobellus litoreus TaxID=755310 RepID=A0ABD6E231_9EURY|nr:hydantoinase/oxoprolinase family protein [Halobellus litoreus]
MTESTIRIGADVGGTNTDIILVDGTEEHTYKLPTTDDPSKSTADGVLEVCERAGIAPGEVDTVLHGTTVGTNAVIEHEGAKTGMITTEGFRDTIHIGRHRKSHTFSVQHEIKHQKEPLVERRYRQTVNERIYPPGKIVEPLDESEVREAAAELVEEGVESIAVCYLHSYLDTTHEDRTKEIIQEEFPDVFVSTSNEVVAQFREYERFSTTAINARIAPVMSSYLNRLQERLNDYGFEGADVLIMQSNGGVASIREASQRPVTTLLSGPAAGVLSGQYTGRSADEEKVITFDMGGTSADISVLPGRLLERDPRDSEIGEYPAITPMLDIEAIGSGGGSIAWFDQAQGFNVGPKSAGANPGPACYGRGNNEPTIADAQVVLGRIDPETFLGGELDIDPSLSEKAIDDKLVDAVDQERFSTVEKAALAVLDVANSNMYQSVREQTMQRGYDPRDYSLVGFGGAGPMHTVDLAESLESSKVLIPPSPGIGSARGLMTGDIQYDNQVTLSKRLKNVEADELEDRIESLTQRGADQLRSDGIDVEEDAVFRKSIDCLYEGQGYELNIEYTGTDGDWRSRIREQFEEKHKQEYGHYFEKDPVEVLNLRVAASADSVEYDPVEIESGATDPSHAETKSHPVYFGTSLDPEKYETPRYAREELRAGNVIDGPAIVDEFDSTVVINPEWEAEVLPSGALRITR